jgi:hypothetical protein
MAKSVSSRSDARSSGASKSTEDLEDATVNSSGGFLKRMRTRKSKANTSLTPEGNEDSNKKSSEDIEESDTNGYLAPVLTIERKLSVFRRR